MANTLNDQRTRLEDNLRNFNFIESGDPELRHAAVVIVVWPHEVTQEGDNQLSILLTLRTAKLKQHSGQYALPGGKLDAEETTLQAALRELDEELGIRLDASDKLGQLDDYPTRSGFRITPLVFWAGSGVELNPSPDEVETVYKIPFGELDSDAIPLFEDGVEDGPPVLLSNFPTLGHKMYSPTASIIYQFREVAIRGNTIRVSHFDQPGFAWK